MSKHFLLTSKKTGTRFAIIYFLVRCLYLITPLTTTALIHSIETGNARKFVFLAVFYVVLFLLTQYLDYQSDIAEDNCYTDSYRNLLQLIRRKIKRRDYRYTELSLDEINQLIGQDFEKANKYFFVEIIRFIYYVLSILFIVIVLFRESWQIATVIVALVAVLIPFNLKMGNSIEDSSNDSLESMSTLKSMIHDQYMTDKESRFSSNMQINDILFNNGLNDFKKKNLRKNKEQAFYLNIVSYGSLNMLITFVMILVCFYVLQGKITFSTLYLFNSYTSQLWSPGEFIFEFRAKYKENTPIFNKIRALENMKETDDAEHRGNIETITLSDYVGTGKKAEPLHKPVSFTFSKNHIYLIKGDNGCGKTTLVENILHLTERHTGNIQFNDNNEWINDFTYVPSKPYISEFYNKEIFKGSDGQKKFYQFNDLLRNASTVIILDEPTNYFDTDKKKEFISRVNSLRKDHIILIITHDPVFDKTHSDYSRLELSKQNESADISASF